MTLIFYLQKFFFFSIINVIPFKIVPLELHNGDVVPTFTSSTGLQHVRYMHILRGVAET